MVGCVARTRVAPIACLSGRRSRTRVLGFESTPLVPAAPRVHFLPRRAATSSSPPNAEHWPSHVARNRRACAIGTPRGKPPAFGRRHRHFLGRICLRRGCFSGRPKPRLAVLSARRSVKLRLTRRRGVLLGSSLLRQGGLEIVGRPTTANVRMCWRSMEMRLAPPTPRAVREKDSRAKTAGCRQAISRRPPHNSRSTTSATIAD